MNTKASLRLLSIGEFSAATQLSPKALRLYDEQGILRPASTDSATNYRYYRTDQVATGRLVRTLRDMDVALHDIGEFISVDPARGEALLRHFARASEQRYARQRRAFQSALSLLRQTLPSPAAPIFRRQRHATTVAVHAYSAQRATFIERFHAESNMLKQAVARAGLAALDEPACSLVDALSDEDSRVDLLLPIDPVTDGTMVTRLLPEANCAVLNMPLRNGYLTDLSAALDALFDWLEKQSRVAIEAPTAMLHVGNEGWQAEVSWAFAPESLIER